MESIYLIFYACPRLRLLDVETNHGQRRPVPAVCRVLCSNVRGLAGNLSDLSGRTGSALVWHSRVAGSQLTQCSKSCDLQPALQCATWSSGGTALCRVGGATSQFDLPSLTPLSVAGCG